jgi:hypothetical protein
MKWYNLKGEVSRKEAKLILKYMQEIIDRYGYVTLADFYDLEASDEAVYTDNKKEWRSLKGARVSSRRKEGVYRILLPDFVERI